MTEPVCIAAGIVLAIFSTATAALAWWDAVRWKRAVKRLKAQAHAEQEAT